MKKVYGLILLGVLMTAGCASNGRTLNTGPTETVGFGDDPFFDAFEEEYAQRQVVIADPLEPVNRVMFGFNDVFYFWVAKPVMQTYEHAVPRPARIGIRNFFDNLTTPVRVVNNLLQGKNEQAGREIDRFVTNTTVGVLGFGDPAQDRYNLPPSRENLGRTLSGYGFGDGFYIVWPFLGPSTLRDSVGMAGDAFLNPVRYVKPIEASIGISAANGVNKGSFYIGDYEAFKEASIDPYVAMRTAYVQYRNSENQARPMNPED